jgi:hypothetical protein
LAWITPWQTAGHKGNLPLIQILNDWQEKCFTAQGLNNRQIDG